MKKLVALLMMVTLYAVSVAGGLITPEKLNKIKDKKDVVVLDYRWNKVPEKTIPGAMVVLNKDFSRERDGVKGMVLPKEEFESFMSKMGIENKDTVVIVDDNGMMNATRLWWILNLYGHKGDVFILDGQIMAWEKSGLPMAAPSKPSKTSKYVAKDANPKLVATLEEVKASIEDNQMVVLDARSKLERIKGHIPNSVFIEWKENITKDGKYKSKAELKKLYRDSGITKNLKAIMPHCKSAVRSTQSMFALVEILGYDNVKNYDGSWLEYEAVKAPVKYGM
ncbi:rhodanese-like domain-containing protein [uncultured Ilyobacter sp.]|uniref:sulfurtransferase n=1 Tax=uncultured Ilyobacter sp. TaxID=544433 RepID=UPI002AA85C8D|nr:rhodanese-like domain-containing protein [uncultured Ilyobacter sp.]